VKYHLDLAWAIARAAFFTVVAVFCGAMILYALVDIFVILSTLVWTTP
jgi:hypothetical protein